MSADHIPVPQRDIDTIQQGKRKPLFDLGQIVATPAALALLERHCVFPATPLSFHAHGEWGGSLSEADRKANDAAVLNGDRIFSAYEFNGERMWVITEAASDAGNRASTCLLLPSEY